MLNYIHILILSMHVKTVLKDVFRRKVMKKQRLPMNNFPNKRDILLEQRQFHKAYEFTTCFLLSKLVQNYYPVVVDKCFSHGKFFLRRNL